MGTVTDQNLVNIPQLHSTKVLDEQGHEVMLGDLWQKSPVIFVYLRHFACMSCRSHASDVWKNRTQYTRSGAQLFFIGNGAPFLIEAFKEDLGMMEAKIFTDPSLKSFYAAGFKRGFIAALGPTAIKNAVKSYLKDGLLNSSYEKSSGDLWQLGGILAVKPGDVVTFHYLSEVLGDFPPEEEIQGTPWVSKK